MIGSWFWENLLKRYNPSMFEDSWIVSSLISCGGAILLAVAIGGIGFVRYEIESENLKRKRNESNGESNRAFLVTRTKDLLRIDHGCRGEMEE